MEKQLTLSIYRLDAWNDLDRYFQESEISEFLKFVNKVYKLLLDLKPGESMVLEKDVRPEKRKLFVQVACLFILENHPDYQFSADYLVIKRLRVNPEARIKKITLQFNKKRRKKNELERPSGDDCKNAPRK